jgi:hypothetical protein
MLAVNSTLRVLDLEGCGFSEAAGAALGGALAQNRGLERLELSENHLGGHGVQGLVAGLETNRTLRTLRLDGVRAGILGAEELARALARNGGALTHLSFAGNRIRNSGAAALAPAVAAHLGLAHLDLSFNDFDRVGAAPLLALLERATEPGGGGVGGVGFDPRAHRAVELHLDLAGNDGCEGAVAPHLARSKLRWDFLGATARPRLASNPAPFARAGRAADPRVVAASGQPAPSNAAATQGGVW